MYFFRKFRRSIVLTLCAFVVSYLAAAFLNTTTYAWPLVERMPQRVVEIVGRILLVALWPLLPGGVHEQEEMLELLLIWVFSGLALLPLAVLMLSIRHDVRRDHSSSRQSAGAQCK